MNTLSINEIQDFCAQYKEWSMDENKIKANFTCSSFESATAFLVQVSLIAQKLDHPPEWSGVYNKISFNLTTHDAGDNITNKDIELAKKISAICSHYSKK